MNNTVPLLAECDVLVVGGGPAGSIAAVAAARQGARTIVLERHGFFGGNLTAGGIDTMYGFYTVGEDQQQVIGGIPDEVVDRLRSMEACFLRHNTYGSGTGVTFSPEHLKIVLENLTSEAGVTVFYHAFVPDVVLDADGELAGVLVATKQGIKRIQAQFIIDATGDADIVAHAGGQYEKAGVGGKPIQSCTTVFFMANVDIERAKAFGKQNLWDAMREGNESGAYDLPRIEGSWHATPYPGLIETNMTRVANVDTTDLAQVSAAETEGRRQTLEYVRFLQDQVPGFEQAYLVKTGSHIGVREARRIVGDYVLTAEDAVEGRRFDDAIARCGMPIEDHHAGSDTRWEYVKNGGAYDIPYRCLIPRGLDRVLVAGRCLSATHDAHASARSSATAMGMGQAAGVAATLALEHDGLARTVAVTALQDRLRDIGALL